MFGQVTVVCHNCTHTFRYFPGTEDHKTREPRFCPWCRADLRYQKVAGKRWYCMNPCSVGAPEDAFAASQMAPCNECRADYLTCPSRVEA